MGTASVTTQSLAATVEKDGYVVVKSFLDKDLVAQARRDLEAIYARDIEERGLRNADTDLFTHGSTKSIRSEATHLVLGLPGKSKALDQCYEKIFSDPTTRDLIRAIAGDHIKIRDVNCRYMTGAYDPGDFLNGAMEWHRDSAGEFCIAIPLNEVPEGENGATAVAPGSHRYPWDPRWKALFGAPFHISRDPLKAAPSVLTRFNPFNRLLFKRHMKNHTGAFAKPGDFYIFLNDTWHGRVPNRHGAQAMIAMAGAFSTDFPFPDNPAKFPPEMIERLPPVYRRAAARDAPVNTYKDTVVHRMLRTRKRDLPTDLFWWARMEREAVVAFYKIAVPARKVALWFYVRVPFLRPIVRRVFRGP
jgi:ectoine hydroxylase-related dioxygenase (phytanoyl-CoA dioxygenase family)